MRRALLSLLLLGLPVVAEAQSSQFGIRGLGYPSSPYSARARGMGGATAIFDAESALNPASLGYLTEMTAAFSVVDDRRVVEGPGGNGNTQGMRFPLFSIGGPMRNAPLTFGVSANTYLARDFTVRFVDTVTIAGEDVETLDTLSAQGGLNDLRFSAAWRIDQRTVVGGAIHAITGVTRLQRVRYFEADGFEPVSEHSEVSAAGVGFDVGLLKRLSPRLTFGAVLRSDGSVRVRTDSLTASEYPVNLPLSIGAGFQYRSSPRLLLASQFRWAGWGAADDDLSTSGAPGAVSTWEIAAGGELTRNLELPYRLPLRFGVRHAKLPFPLVANDEPSETVLSLGTGLLFSQGMGGADLSVERVWRGDGGDFSERAWTVSLTATLRPNRRSR